MINDDLADAILARELNLNRFDAELRRRVSEKLSKMDQDILKELQGDITSWNRAYFNEKLRDLRKLIDDYYTEISDMTAKDMADLSESEMTWLQTEVNDLVGTDLFSKPTKDPEKLSLESLVQGATLASWWLKLSADAYFRVSTQMRIGYGIGDKNVAEKVKAQLKTNKSSASTIVTNATRTVASDSRNVVYLKNASKIAGKKYVAVLDNRTSLGCIAYDGSTYTMDNKPIGKKSLPYRELPAHFNCIAGDTLVSTSFPISYISKRVYQGNLYILTTASGNSIKVTPNHPILTNRGFIEAQLINKLDKIATKTSGKSLTLVDLENNQSVARIEDLFTAYSKSSEMVSVTMPVSTEDFHSDVTNEEVNVVFIDRKLWFKCNSSIYKNIFNLFFIDRRSFGSGLSNLSKRFVRIDSANGSGMSFFDLLKSLLFGHNAPFNKLLFRLSSNVNSLLDKLITKFADSYTKAFGYSYESNSMSVQSDTTFESKYIVVPSLKVQGGSSTSLQNIGDSSISDSVLFSDIANGKMVDKVFFDDVVNVEFSEFGSHDVYNLENDYNYYTANNLISHNCRSVYVVYLKEAKYLEDIPPSTRSSMDGQVPATMNFAEFLDRKGKAFQDEVLGKGKAQLWREGKITLQQLIDQSGNPVTLKELDK